MSYEKHFRVYNETTIICYLPKFSLLFFGGRCTNDYKNTKNIEWQFSGKMC